MISEGAELCRDDIKRLDDAEEFVVATATDAQLQVLAFRARAGACEASVAARLLAATLRHQPLQAGEVR
jgi:hypothetical protein